MHVKLRPDMQPFPSCYGPEIPPWDRGACQLMLDDDLILGTLTCRNPGQQLLEGSFTPVWEADRFPEEFALLRNGQQDEAREQLAARRLRLQSTVGPEVTYPYLLYLDGDRARWTP